MLSTLAAVQFFAANDNTHPQIMLLLLHDTINRNRKDTRIAVTILAVLVGGSIACACINKLPRVCVNPRVGDLGVSGEPECERRK